MARTMIHESVHAYLTYTRQGEPTGNMIEALTAYIVDNDLPYTVNNNLHHNFMSQFIDAIASQLWEWDITFGTGGTLGWQYYQDMAWGGMTEYPDPNDDTTLLTYEEFDNYLDQTVENLNGDSNLRKLIEARILDRIKDEKLNTSDSSQNGNENDCQ